MTTGLELRRRGAAGAVSALTYAQEVLADSPAIYLPFSEGTVAPVDLSTNAFTPTVDGSLTSIADGPGGKRAYRFPGGSSNRIQVPDHANLDLGDTFTIEYWLRPITLGTDQDIVDKGSGAYLLRRASSNKLMMIRSGVAVIVEATATMTDTAHWYHCVGTKTGGTVKLYLDSVDVTGSVTNATCANNSIVLGVGAGPSWVNALNGDLAQVAVYPTALSAARVLAHYGAIAL